MDIKSENEGKVEERVGFPCKRCYRGERKGGEPSCECVQVKRKQLRGCGSRRTSNGKVSARFWLLQRAVMRGAGACGHSKPQS